MVVGGVLPPAGATVFEQMQSLRATTRFGASCSASRAGRSRCTPICSCRRRATTATRATSSWSRPSTRRCRARTRSASRPSCSRPGWSSCASPRRRCVSRRPAGVVEVRAACRDGRVESVELTNVPCFVDRLDAPLEVDGLGTLSVDVAYGGMWYAIADAARARLRDRAATRRASSRPSASASASPRASSSRACIRRTPASRASVIVQIAEPWQGVGAIVEERRRRRSGPPRSLRDGHRAVGAAGDVCTRAERCRSATR